MFSPFLDVIANLGCYFCCDSFHSKFTFISLCLLCFFYFSFDLTVIIWDCLAAKICLSLTSNLTCVFEYS